MNKVAIACEGVVPPPWMASARRFVRTVFTRLGRRNSELSILLCDNKTIQKLNAEYRKKDSPTDVLSFSQEEGEGPPRKGKPVIAGDLVISLEKCEENAREYGVTVNDELKRLIVHGLLHLSGNDHRSDSTAEPMLIVQEKLLHDMKEVRII